MSIGLGLGIGLQNTAAGGPAPPNDVIELEDGSGYIELEDGSGYIELETGP